MLSNKEKNWSVFHISKLIPKLYVYFKKFLTKSYVSFCTALLPNYSIKGYLYPLLYKSKWDAYDELKLTEMNELSLTLIWTVVFFAILFHAEDQSLMGNVEPAMVSCKVTSRSMLFKVGKLRVCYLILRCFKQVNFML